MSQMSTASGNQTYSVKYLGIVDGAMGILSRKMAMQNGKKEEVKNGNPRDHVDLRGEGGYIIAHPSYNPKTENSYEWISGGFDRSLLKPFPYDLFPSKKEKKKKLKRLEPKNYGVMGKRSRYVQMKKIR